MSAPSQTILITAFEPSGDALAAGLIAELRSRRPEMKIYALGGPKMAAAGAELIETTTERAVMLGGAISHALSHHRRLKRLDRWLRDHPIAALVPTDSPAANWSICKLVRRLQPKAKIVHLAAPQVWAWAGWRIHKLRRLTDHVLCLLPFEPAWFAERNVPATFVGHPVFEQVAQQPQASLEFPNQVDGPKIAVLPGSRRSEVHSNLLSMLTALEECHRTRGGKGKWDGGHATRNVGINVAVAAFDQKIADLVRSVWASGDMVTDFDAPLHIFVGQTDAVIAWADIVLVVSGTATLQVAAHKKPMVALYKVSCLMWNFIGRWIVNTRTFTLPNLISEADGKGRVITELVPHFGAIAPVVEEVDRLLRDPAAREKQRVALARVCSHFEGVSFGQRAAEKLLEVVEGQPPLPKKREEPKRKKGRSR